MRLLMDVPTWLAFAVVLMLGGQTVPTLPSETARFIPVS
jgi:hypothetical protein